MKRYIRTEDNLIFDMKEENIFYDVETERFIDPDDYTFTIFIKSEIICESDNILDLIEAGDLVEIDYGIETCTEKVCQPDKVRESKVVRIYAKQGDNYILVWDKERGVI